MSNANEEYRRELAAIVWLKKTHPPVYDAALRLLAREVGTSWNRFFQMREDEYTNEKAVRIHATCAAQEKMVRILKDAEATLASMTTKEEPEPEQDAQTVPLAVVLAEARKTAPSYIQPPKESES